MKRGRRSRGTFEPNQFFGIGMTVGVVVGFAAGSVLTLWLGDDTLEALRDLLDRLSGRRERVNFEFLLQ